MGAGDDRERGDGRRVHDETARNGDERAAHGERDDADPRAVASSRRAVRETYDEIAAHFSKTRVNPWSEVESFLEGRTGRVGLDLGTGNGRHAGPLAARVDRVLGVDASVELLGLARRRAVEEGYADAFHPVAGDAARLPLPAGAVDLALYVATLHHLPSRSLRRESLSELGRVLVPGGAAFVSAWSTAHDRFDADPEDPAGFDTTVDWTLPDGETVPRYYHIYAPAEFEADLEASSLAVERSFVSSGNCYAVVSGSGRSTGFGTGDCTR